MNDIRIDYSLDPTKPFGTMPGIYNDGKIYLIKQIMAEVDDELLMPDIYYGCLISTYVDNIVSSVNYSYIPFINISIGFRLDFTHHNFYKFGEPQVYFFTFFKSSVFSIIISSPTYL